MGRRGKNAVSITANSANMSGDYSNSKTKFGTGLAYKFYFNKPNLNLNVGLGYFQLENEQAFKDDFMSFDINLEYDILPFDQVSPFVYGGIGTVSNLDISNPYFKFQYGAGAEFLPVNNIGIKIFAEHNVLL